MVNSSICHHVRPAIISTISLAENNDNQGEAEEVKEHNQNMAEEDFELV